MRWLSKWRRKRNKKKQNARIIAAATDYIQKNCLYLDPSLKCEKVAKGIGSNRTYLWEALRSCGFGFQEYLSKFRIAYFVANAPSFANLSIDEIAERCGFCDYRYLNKYLKKMFGISLCGYMRLIKKEVPAT